jgi:hypothetical protein
MKKILTVFAIIIFASYAANSTPLTGGVSEHGAGNVVVDAQTHSPIVDAQISLPQKGYRTKTDEKGAFTLNATINDETILSVQKEGYRPYSITIDKEIASHPMVLGIQKSELMDVVIDSDMLHLGDNTFSSDSANAKDFKLQAIGPTYTKQFKMTTNTLNYTNYLVIGSIIGIDTEMARRMKQNTITNSYSSPPEVYFNGKKIAEIKLNGDNQKIKLPKAIIRPDDVNEITIQTGVNLFQKARVDYDDIELMNLSILSE